MAVTLIRAARQYVGLSTDSKPTAEAGAMFIETDTGIVSVSDGSTWNMVRKTWPLR